MLEIQFCIFSKIITITNKGYQTEKYLSKIHIFQKKKGGSLEKRCFGGQTKAFAPDNKDTWVASLIKRRVSEYTTMLHYYFISVVFVQVQFLSETLLFVSITYSYSYTNIYFTKIKTSHIIFRILMFSNFVLNKAHIKYHWCHEIFTHSNHLRHIFQ